jgi:hypothetical protein
MQQYPGPFPKKKWSRQARPQIKTLRKDKIKKLLDKDPNWEFVRFEGGRATYRNRALQPPYDYLVIHPSEQEFKNPSLVFWMLDHICWEEKDLQEWKVLQ